MKRALVLALGSCLASAQLALIAAGPVAAHEKGSGGGLSAASAP